MSLILKGIDLPSKGNYLNIVIFADGAVYTKTNCGENTEKAQAIQIPKKHGDIKDINAFLKDKSLYEYIENDVFNKKYSYWAGMGAIYNAPTILEAEANRKTLNDIKSGKGLPPIRMEEK